MSWLALISGALALLVVPAAVYLGWLALLAWSPGRRADVSPSSAIAVVIPAHDEAAQIAHTVASTLATDYPPALRRVVVVADNCSDETAARARDAGAEVLERRDPDHRGKGFALDHAFVRLLGEPTPPDAIAVVDADSDLSADLLRAFDARLQGGALAVQAEYAVRNPDASWRTRLLAVALGMFHRTRSLARERLGLSAGLRGNGMCFSAALLRDHPHRAVSLVEDVEYGVQLGLAGIRVHFAAEAQVRGEMVSTGSAAVSQRRRWEQGRWAMVRAYVPRLLIAALRQRSGLCLDLAADLLVPPLSTVVLGVLVGVLVEAMRLAWGEMAWGGTTWAWGAAVLSLALYGLRGVQHSGLGWRAVPALAFAPAYVLWKLAVARPFGRKPGEWIRTRREGPRA